LHYHSFGWRISGTTLINQNCHIFTIKSYIAFVLLIRKVQLFATCSLSITNTSDWMSLVSDINTTLKHIKFNKLKFSQIIHKSTCQYQYHVCVSTSQHAVD
jgi:hypothetical protein